MWPKYLTVSHFKLIKMTYLSNEYCVLIYRDYLETLGEDAPLIPQWLVCSWDHAVLSGHVAHKDRCELQQLSASLLSKR